MKNIATNHWSYEQWTQELSRLDYAPDPASGGWRHNGVAFKAKEDWSVIEASATAALGGRQGDMGRPGLWKTILQGPGARRVFDLPTALLVETGEDAFLHDEPRPFLDEALAWAQATVDGGVPDGWRPPAREQVESWIPKGGLTIHHRGIVRQGELVHAPDCLALRVPVLPVLPPNLPEVNARFLEQILLEATDAWRLVRIGVVEDDATLAVMAEVNFTGASAPVIERLISVSLASLHWASLWLAESAEVLADVTLTHRALALCGHSQSVIRKEQTP